MQLAQERQTGRGLAFEQHQDDWEISDPLRCLSSASSYSSHLPIADAPLADQQDEGVRLRDFLGERFLTKSLRRAGSRARRTPERQYPCAQVAALSRSASA